MEIKTSGSFAGSAGAVVVFILAVPLVGALFAIGWQVGLRIYAAL